MFKKLFIVMLALLAGLCAYAAMQKEDYLIARSKVISAPAPVLYKLVNNAKLFNSWNPWAKIDPNSKVTFEGPEEGPGSIMRWEGNADVGKGSMTNLQAEENKSVTFRMDFVEPLQGTSTAVFTFTPEEGGTKVTWSMSGKNNFVGKLINVLVDCNKMVGEQFELGLNNLEAAAAAQH